MGVRDVLGLEPADVMRKYGKSATEEVRRQKAKTRVALYQDNIAPYIREAIHRLFNREDVRARIEPFGEFAGVMSLCKRIVDETCRHTYAPGPLRLLTTPADTQAYGKIVAESRQNERMALAMRLMNATNVSWVGPRYWPAGKKFLLDVLTPDITRIVPHPENPLEELALIFDSGDEEHRQYVFEDDTERAVFDKNLQLVSTEPNPYGRLRWVAIHRAERWGTYWDETTGSPLVAGTILEGVLMALSVKHLKSQGFKQPVITGDTDNIDFDQPLDEESAFVMPEGTQLDTLDLKSDSSHYIALAEFVSMTIAANYGLNRDRMNAKTNESGAEDTALLERRQEQVAIASEAERRLLELWVLVSKEHPDASFHLSAEAAYERQDFGDLEARLSLKDQLMLWDQMERMGVSDALDVIMSRNPEIKTRPEALEHYLEKLDFRALRIKLEREMNAPEDMNAVGVGQDPAVNGAMGPRARGGLPPGNGARGFQQGNSVSDET